MIITRGRLWWIFGESQYTQKLCTCMVFIDRKTLKGKHLVYRHTLPISKHPHSSHQSDVNDVIRASLTSTQILRTVEIDH